MLEIIVKLPEELVRDAREFNLLTDNIIAELLQMELDQRVNALVNTEIQDYRTEKNKRTKSQKSE